MSTAVTATLGSDIDLSEPGAALPAPGLSNPGLSSLAPLHRLAEARRQEGISRRTVARHLKISIGQVRAGTGGPRSFAEHALRMAEGAECPDHRIVGRE